MVSLVMLAAPALAGGPKTPVKDPATCSLVDGAIKEASRIRKLTVLLGVPCKLQSKTEVEKYLKEAITKNVPRSQIDYEGAALKLIGLIPRSFDYYQGLVDTYSDQLAGYYEPDGHFYAMASWLPESMQVTIAIHELTHALQDQHFNLQKFTDEATLTTDELMARTALVEGDAMGVMIDYEREQHQQPPLEQTGAIQEILASELVTAATTSAGTVPKSLEELLMFPYLSGLRFVHTLLRHGGHSVMDKAFLLPPQSTEQILHPEIFFTRREHSGFENLPEARADEPGMEHLAPVFSDTLGEFSIAVLLSQWLATKDAAKAGWGWGGDRLNLFETKDQKTFLLLWRTRWDTVEDADDFFEKLGSGYTVRFARVPDSPAKANPNEISFHGTEVGSVRIKRSGRDVTVRFHGKRSL